jgi:Ca-activated chloride channel family protein
VVTGPAGEPLAVPPDPATLRAISERSGGSAFAVDQADELDRVYEKLGSQIGTRKEEREISAAFAAGGLALLLGGVGAASPAREARVSVERPLRRGARVQAGQGLRAAT